MSGIFIVDLRCNCGWTKVLSFQRDGDTAAQFQSRVNSSRARLYACSFCSKPIVASAWAP